MRDGPFHFWQHFAAMLRTLAVVAACVGVNARPLPARPVGTQPFWGDSPGTTHPTPTPDPPTTVKTAAHNKAAAHTSAPTAHQAAPKHTLDDSHGHTPTTKHTLADGHTHSSPELAQPAATARAAAATARAAGATARAAAATARDNRLTPHHVQLKADYEDGKHDPEESLPQLQSHPVQNGGVVGACANHWRAQRACTECAAPWMRNAAKERQANYSSSWKSATFLYPHAPKTGGSTLECATERNPLQARWVNMGHTNGQIVTDCTEACTFDEQPPKVVVMIREPYDFWASRFLFAWNCDHAKSCTQYFNIKSFIEFLRFVRRKGDHSPWEPQSLIHRNFCGQPCKHDFAFHTETMQDDWIALMDKIGEPRSLLPRLVNPSTRTNAPAIEFTSEALDIIHEIDANMFEEWGYKKRHESFALTNMTRLNIPSDDSD